MLSVVIPTLNAEAGLASTLSALVPAAVEGLVREVVVVDGGSTDRTLGIADQAGVDVVSAAPGRGQQLIAGAARARFPWLLFLHADTELQPGFERELHQLLEGKAGADATRTAAAFAFALDDQGVAPRIVEWGVAVRCALFKMPYGDQALLIHRSLYQEIGGYRPLPLMEDVDLVRRLGRSRIRMLRSRAVTSAHRYRRDGYARRIFRNQVCLAMYLAGFSAERIQRRYLGLGPKHHVPIATTERPVDGAG